MKTFFKSHLARKFLLLVGAVLLIVMFLTHQSKRHLRLQKRISATAVAITKAKQTEVTLLDQQKSTVENMALLAEYEKRIPAADEGYVWVSRVVRGAVPSLALTVSPPEFDGTQAPLSPNYCCGTFDVRGSGRLDELLQVLQKVESDLPFARVRALHFSFSGEQVNFSFSLMAVMRLGHESES
ncbi:MAG: hypothetical protein H0X66_05840 [Verrucomicrobia bacterium]|nr:hypothetical protein [Verrucomicrobiota bacterium]